MAEKKNNPGKRGRKPAPPGAKLTQLTIRLPPTQRLGLQLLARDRGMSVSQAVEFALSTVLREYRFEGTNIEDFVFRWGPREKLGMGAAGRGEAEALAEQVVNSYPLFVLLLPERLRMLNETFFVSVVEFFGVRTPKGLMEFGLESGMTEELWLHSQVAFRRGSTPEEAAEEWKEMMDSLPPP